jgi:translation initiation factor IF-2
MNVTELSRRVRIPTQRLKEVLPELGFDIGMRAIKVDDRVAQAIIEKLSNPEVRARILMPRKIEVEEEGDAAAAAATAHAIVIPAKITVKEFAGLMGLPVTKVIIELMKQGVMAAQNQFIDFDTASIIASDLGRKVERGAHDTHHASRHEAQEEKLLALLKGDEEGTLQVRAPVVVVMGHVDHGKTTLLDAIRKTHVTAQEHGGITQHIGAYQVVQQNRPITFIDTPGHEAFTAMRSRGARVADIAILVVAADDGVQPQTIEALTHIQRAQLPFIVALNKIDKTGANPDRVKQDLANVNVLSEGWGGKTPFIEISAKQGTGIPELLDLVLLLTDMEHDRIRANPQRTAVGTIIESHIDAGEGPVATVLVQTGTLRVGDLVHMADAFGKVKAMKDYQGKQVKEAPPSTPVRILGLKSLPQVGDILEVTADSAAFKQKMRDARPKKRPIRFGDAPAPTASSTEDADDEAAKLPEVSVMLRTDVLGSLEAIHEALEPVKHPEVKVAIIQEGVGNITEADVLAAEASGALVLGFNVEAAGAAEEIAKDKGVRLKTFTIIYELVDEVKSAVEALLAPEVKETNAGVLGLLAVFRQEKSHVIIGGRVLHGKLRPGHLFRVKRGGKDVGKGKIGSVQIGKQQVPEVFEGQECGMKVETRASLAAGDSLECYTEERKKREI